MIKKIKLRCALILAVSSGFVSNAATVVSFNFDQAVSATDDAVIGAPELKNLSGLLVSDMSYVQGAKADSSVASVPVCFAGAPDRKLFAVSSLNTGSNVTNYTEEASRLTFTVSAAGKSADFSRAMLFCGFNAIAPAGENYTYRANIRLAYRVNDGSWVTLAQKRMDTGKEAGTPLEKELLKVKDGTLWLSKFPTKNPPVFFESKVSWSLAEVGTLKPGTRIEFALLLFDQRDIAYYAVLLDDIRISGLSETSEDSPVPDMVGQAVPLPPATPGIFLSGACVVLLSRKRFH